MRAIFFPKVWLRPGYSKKKAARKSGRHKTSIYGVFESVKTIER